MNIKGLIIAGGRSSRMGCDKATLEIDGVPLFRRAQACLSEHISEVWVSARADAPWAATFAQGDRVFFDDQPDLGPASALLSAHQHDGEAAWLVLACDFALATSDAARQLLQARDLGAMATAFENDAGVVEPLFAIWEAPALKMLVENFHRGLAGPAQTLRQLPRVARVRPHDALWLSNVNTPDDWQAAVARFSQFSFCKISEGAR